MLSTAWSVSFISLVHLFLVNQGYVDFGRFDKFNYFVSGSGHADFVQVSLVSNVNGCSFLVFFLLHEDNLKEEFQKNSN